VNLKLTQQQQYHSPQTTTTLNQFVAVAVVVVIVVVAVVAHVIHTHNHTHPLDYASRRMIPVRQYMRACGGAVVRNAVNTADVVVVGVGDVRMHEDHNNRTAQHADPRNMIDADANTVVVVVVVVIVAVVVAVGSNPP